MESVSYFFELLKQHTLLSAILSTGSFSRIDLSKYDHDIDWQQHILEIRNFRLNPDAVFENLHIVLKADSYLLTFHNKSTNYFDEAQVFFDKATSYEYGLLSSAVAQTQNASLSKKMERRKVYDMVCLPFSLMPYVIAEVETDTAGSTITLMFLNKEKGEYEAAILEKLKQRSIGKDLISIEHLKGEYAEGMLIGFPVD